MLTTRGAGLFGAWHKKLARGLARGTLPRRVARRREEEEEEEAEEEEEEEEEEE